jgi:hypothetical protein
MISRSIGNCPNYSSYYRHRHRAPQSPLVQLRIPERPTFPTSTGSIPGNGAKLDGRQTITAVAAESVGLLFPVEVEGRRIPTGRLRAPSQPSQGAGAQATPSLGTKRTSRRECKGRSALFTPTRLRRVNMRFRFRSGPREFFNKMSTILSFRVTPVS